MRRYIYLLIIFFSFFNQNNLFGSDIINLSRNSCVKVYSIQGNSKGSGFFISEDLIVTCFHVIASIESDSQNINWNIYSDIKVITSNNDTISAKCISIPGNFDASPLFRDFAVLKLFDRPKELSNYVLQFSDFKLDNLEIGATCYFSGYPLLTPTMVTHKGMISGTDSSNKLICVQGAINKGNSGGALLSENGTIIGIISMREGGISKALEELAIYIESTSKQGSVRLMGVDPLLAINATIETLNTYISTGIGYARFIEDVKDYCYKYNFIN